MAMQRCRQCGERVQVPCIMVMPSAKRWHGRRVVLVPVPSWPELEPVEARAAFLRDEPQASGEPDAFKAHNLDLVERGRIELPVATFVPVGER